MEYLTLQEIFDKCVAHLRKQNKKSYRGYCSLDAYCAYRGKDNTKCAVGCFIPDLAYTQIIEGITISQVLAYTGTEESPQAERIVILKSLLQLSGLNLKAEGVGALLEALQTLHDKSSGPNPFRSVAFRRWVAEIADRFGLTPPMLKSDFDGTDAPA